MSKLVKKEMAYDWAKIPIDLPRENLVLITAKTTNPTVHPEDPEYTVRIFNPDELKEAARSLAQRAVGLDHNVLIEGAFTVDANWNETEQAVEALLYLPTPYIKKVRDKQITKVSVEYTWRDEKREGKQVEFKGLVFNRVDLLSARRPGDSNTEIKLLTESKRGLMEGIITSEGIQQDDIQTSIDNPSESFFKEACEEAMAFTKRLGEPFAGYKDFADCVAKNKDKDNPEAYCGYIKHKVEDPKKEETVEEGLQVPEKPVNPIAQEPAPVVPIPISQSMDPSNVVTSIGAVGNDKGPIVNQGENKEKCEGDDAVVDIVEKLGGEQPQAGLGTSLTESTSNASNPSVSNPTIPPTTSTSPIDNPASALTQPDPKDARIKELEEAVVRLQGTNKALEEGQTKAIEEAKAEGKKEVIEKVKAVLPPERIITNFNPGQAVIKDIRRVIKECVKD